MTRSGDFDSSKNVDVVVLATLDLEYAAMRAHLSGLVTHIDANGIRYEAGELPGGGQVALTLTGPGTLAAAATASRAIMSFQPKALVFAGIAGGLVDDVELGDVVVATRVHTYGSGHAPEGFRPRLKSWPLSSSLEQVARDIARAGTWARLLPKDTATVPAVHFKALISGEVVLNARDGLVAKLAEHYPDAVAFDMEGAGVAEAAHRNDFHGTIVVQAVADRMSEGKMGSDAIRWTQRAAANAAAFVVALAERVALGLPLDNPFCLYVAGDDYAAAEALAAAITELFAQQEIEAVPDGPPQIASWFQRFTLRAKRSLSNPEIASRLAKVEHAIEVVALHDPMSKVNEQQAGAMATLLTAAEKCDNFVALAGSIVLVKHTDNAGNRNVYAKTLSVAEVRAFERNQHLLTSPAEALKHLRLLSTAHETQPTPTTPSMNSSAAYAHNDEPAMAHPQQSASMDIQPGGNQPGGSSSAQDAYSRNDPQPVPYGSQFGQPGDHGPPAGYGYRWSSPLRWLLAAGAVAVVILVIVAVAL